MRYLARTAVSEFLEQMATCRKWSVVNVVSDYALAPLARLSEEEP